MNRKTLAAAVVATAVATTGCSATSQQGAGGSADASSPAGATGGTPHSGKVRVLLELPGSAATTGADGTKFLTATAAIKRLFDGLGLAVSFYDPTADSGGGSTTCTPKVTRALSGADVVLASQGALPTSLVTCALASKRPVVNMAPQLSSRKAWAASPGLVAPARVSAAAWGTAAGKVLTGLPQRPRKVALLWPPAIDRVLSDAPGVRAELLGGLRSAGLDAVEVPLPDPEKNAAGFEAALAVVPVRLRQLGVDAIASLFDGFGSFQALVRQKFTPPVVLDTTDGLAAKSWPAGQIHQLPVRAYDTAEAQAVGSLLDYMKRTEPGQRCAQHAQSGGVQQDVALVKDLLYACVEGEIVAAALKQDPSAAWSVAAFTAALRAVGQLKLADGSVAHFGPDGRGMATQLTHGISVGDCMCTHLQGPAIDVDGRG